MTMLSQLRVFVHDNNDLMTIKKATILVSM